MLRKRTIFPIDVVDVEGGWWRTVYTTLSQEMLESFLNSGTNVIPVKRGCCTQAVAFHAFRLKDGREWDTQNGWRD